MKNGILGQYMMSDAREASRTLLISLESIDEMEQQEQKTAEVVEHATTLALRVGRDFPENSDLQENMFKVLETMGATEGVNVSNESLLGLAGKLSGFWRKPKPDASKLPDSEKTSGRDMDKAIRELMVEIEKTYANNTWLAKQKFVEGTVTAKDISGVFQIDGKPVTDPLANIEQHRKNVSSFIGAWNGVLKSLDAQVQSIDKKTESEAKRLASSDEEAAIEVVRKAVEELNGLPDPLEKLPNFSSTAMGNRIPYVDTRYKHSYLEVKPKMSVTPSDTLPALDKDGVLKVANLLKEILKSPDYFPRMPWLSWLDFKDNGWLSHWIYDADNSVYEDYYDRFYWQASTQLWSDGVWTLNNKFAVLTALIKWMDRSIK